MAQNVSAVERAFSDPITNQTLKLMIDVGRDLQYGRCTEEGAALLLQGVGPCLEELLDYRRRAAASLEITPDYDPDQDSNVVKLTDC